MLLLHFRMEAQGSRASDLGSEPAQQQKRQGSRTAAAADNILCGDEHQQQQRRSSRTSAAGDSTLQGDKQQQQQQRRSSRTAAAGDSTSFGCEQQHQQLRRSSRTAVPGELSNSIKPSKASAPHKQREHRSKFSTDDNEHTGARRSSVSNDAAAKVQAAKQGEGPANAPQAAAKAGRSLSSKAAGGGHEEQKTGRRLSATATEQSAAAELAGSSQQVTSSKQRRSQEAHAGSTAATAALQQPAAPTPGARQEQEAHSNDKGREDQAAIQPTTAESHQQAGAGNHNSSSSMAKGFRDSKATISAAAANAGQEQGQSPVSAARAASADGITTAPLRLSRRQRLSKDDLKVASQASLVGSAAESQHDRDG